MTPQPFAPPRVRRLVVLLCLLLAIASTAHAAEARPELAGITVRNNYMLTREDVVDALPVQEGEPFDNEAFRRAVQEWNETAGLGTLSYRVEPAGEGAVELLIEVDERLTVTRISFRGNKRFSDKRLRELVGLEPGDSVGRYELGVAEQAIEQAYKSRGFPISSVQGIAAMEDGRREIIFHVDEGPRTYVKKIVFTGNDHIRAGKLRRRMETKKRRWPAFMWPGWFDRGTFEADLPRLQTFYRNQGYLEAEVTGDASYSENMKKVTLQVQVEEGPLYTVADIRIEGNRLFRDEELLDAIPLEEGAAYRPPQMDETTEAISELYAEQGHLDVTPPKGNLQVEPVFPAEGTGVTVSIRITEGEPVRIRRIEIRGLTKTKEEVVRRNLNIYPGERATSGKLEESEQLLVNTGFFDRQARQPVQITLQPDEGTLRDAIVRVKEGPTGRLLLGAGIGSESGLIGEISLTEDNFDISNWPSSWRDLWRGNAFRGGGQQLTLILRAGTERSFYSVGWLNPSVNNSEYSVGVNLYSTGVARNEFDETRTGFSVSGGQELSKFMRRQLTVGYESIDIDDIDAASSPIIRRDRGSHSKPFVRLSGTIDRRDNRFVPTEGHYARGSLEVAAGDVDAVKLELEGKKYWTVFEQNGENKHVVGVRGRMGVVDAYSGGRVPIFERFYAGGFSTLRGFEFEGVSPVAPVTDEQIGGEAMLLGGAEYSLPIAPRDQLRFLTFVDGGYVTEDAEDVFTAWDELRLSVGVGLRWQIPFFGSASLEVNLAAPLLKEDEDDTQSLHFSLGAERRF
ncbi:MAG: POTRA domain-containing protein [Candidatus Brocadiia bacterium]